MYQLLACYCRLLLLLLQEFAVHEARWYWVMLGALAAEMNTPLEC
jgi:hypothetical protein